MYLIRNSKQLVQSYPNFLAEWYTTQQLSQYILSLLQDYIISYPITSWTYAGLTNNENYHVFITDLPSNYGRFFYDILFDTIDNITYPVSHVLPVETELQSPAINRCGLWFNGVIENSYADFCDDATQMQAINDLFNTLNFSISMWVYSTYNNISLPILYKGVFDIDTNNFTDLMFALYPDKWVSTAKTTSFTRPTAATWHLYTIVIQNDSVSIYIDDSLVVQDTGHSYTFVDATIRISTEKQLSAGYFDGAISEFILWNQALTESDVAKIYQDDLTTLQSKIAFAWPMNKIISHDDISTETTHSIPQTSSQFRRYLGYIMPSTGTAYGTAYVARIIDMNLPKSKLLWTYTDTKLLLYVPVYGDRAYQNIFWIPKTVTDIHQYLFFTKFHSFTLWYKPLDYVINIEV